MQSNEFKCNGTACRKTLNGALASITNWSSGLLTSMQQENAKLAQQIASQHSDMVKWLVQVRPAPPRVSCACAGLRLSSSYSGAAAPRREAL